MILITKEEKENILEYYPKVHITRTMRQKSKRHRYYCEEDRRVMAFLKRLRGENVTEANTGRSDRHRRTNGR